MITVNEVKREIKEKKNKQTDGNIICMYGSRKIAGQAQPKKKNKLLKWKKLGNEVLTIKNRK